MRLRLKDDRPTWEEIEDYGAELFEELEDNLAQRIEATVNRAIAAQLAELGVI